MQRKIYNNFVGAYSLRNYYTFFSIGRTPDMNAIMHSPTNYKWHDQTVTFTHIKTSRFICFPVFTNTLSLFSSEQVARITSLISSAPFAFN